MFRKFLVSLVCTSFFSMACGMSVPMLDRSASMPQWERNELSRLVNQYEMACYDPSLRDSRMFKQIESRGSSRQIAKDFVNGCCSTSYDLLNSNLRGPLVTMIDNPIGRELVYRTMAKILPRKRSVDSVKCFLGTLGGTDEMEDINAICNFGRGLGVPLRASTNGLIESFGDGGQCLEKLKKLYEEPIDLAIKGRIFCRVSKGHALLLKKVRDLLVKRITLCMNAAEQRISELLFNLHFNPSGDDSFSPTTKVVSFSGRSTDLTFMSTPMLRDIYGLVAVCTVRKAQTPEEILFHEFSHYFRITMENGSHDDLRNIVGVLFRAGFSRNYLSGMEARWTNTEEIRAIVGLVVESGNLFYDYLNESEFNLVATGDGVRVAHASLVFTRVPYQLLQFIEAGRQEILAGIRSQTMSYDSVLDCI